MSRDVRDGGEAAAGMVIAVAPRPAGGTEYGRPSPVRLLGSLSRLAGRHARPLLTIVACSAAPGVVMVYGVAVGLRILSHTWDTTTLARVLEGTIATAIAVELACSVVAMSTAAVVIENGARGRDVGVREAMRRMLPRLRSVLLVLALLALLLGAASLLALVPGLLLAAALAPALPICVLEDIHAQRALHRSRALTEGLRLRIAGALLVVLALCAGLWVGAWELAMHVFLVGFALLGACITLNGVLVGAFLTVVYEDLLAFKEGGHAEQTAALFE